MADNSILSQIITPKHLVLDSLLAGIQIGLPQFQAGSKGRIFIPSFYGDGSANLIFEFHLTEVKDYQLKLDVAAIDSYISMHSINALSDMSGLRFTVDTLITGGRAYLEDDVQINYTAKNFSDGSVVDKGTSISFRSSDLILGLQIGLQKMPAGSTFTFYLPSSLAYGPFGNGRNIQPNTNLVFNVKLLKVTNH